VLPFDEPALRKAASWQDFKEAQAMLKAGAVTESERTETGWRGSVRIGTRIYRTTVVAKTPTWFDAKCPCPANQREGKFCPHAIATGLHLIAPPSLAPPPEPKKQATNPLPSLSWQIRFLGPWQKSLEKGHASISLEPSEEPACPADTRLTAWLIEQRATSAKCIQLALDPKNLPAFLEIIAAHPRVTADGSPLSVDSGTQIHLADCSLENGQVALEPSPTPLVRIGATFWQITPESLSKTGDDPIPQELLPVFQSLADRKPTRIGLDTFLSHLDTLQTHLDFSASEWFESLQFIPASPGIELRVEGGRSKITASLITSYACGNLPRLENQTVITRNPAAEASATSHFALRLRPTLQTGGKHDPSFELTDPDAIQTFFTRTLKSLPSAWQIRLSPPVQTLCSSYLSVSPQIQTVASDDGSLHFKLSFESDSGAIISTAEIRRLLRSKNSPSNQLGGKQLILSDDIENLIDPLFEELDLRQENGQYIAKGASADIILEISKKLSNKQSTSKQQDYTDLIHIAPPQSLEAELRPYQASGYSWLIDRLKRYGGALLADDMGLGKTLQTIASIEHLFTSYPQTGPALVVVTTSLLGNWQAEFARFAPGRKTVILHGAKRDGLRDSIRAGDVVLTTYATLTRDLAWHLKQDYLVTVIDEASLIRNPDTDHSKAVAKLRCGNRIALTGTPVENSARDLWSIFRFIQPGWLGTRKEFAERYEQPLQSPETSARTSQLLRIKTSPFTLRRTKLEVAPELPSKIFINEFCSLSADQSATYRDLQREGQRRIEEIRDSGQAAAARMATLTTLLRLRQACCDLALFDSEKLKSLPISRRSAKLERLLEITEQSIASGSKLLVFSQFQKQLVEIESQLQTLGIPSLRLDGQTRNRQALVERFQSVDGPPVFLISLKAGGYGLNLTAADVVVHFDPWWNPAAEAQATDRAHRIGQTKPVTVFRLLTRNTVEEKVVALQSSKRALAESLDEAATPTDAPAWSIAELNSLLA
jgi:superfamily II DNA or RNA helicase